MPHKHYKTGIKPKLVDSGIFHGVRMSENTTRSLIAEAFSSLKSFPESNAIQIAIDWLNLECWLVESCSSGNPALTGSAWGWRRTYKGGRKTERQERGQEGAGGRVKQTEGLGEAGANGYNGCYPTLGTHTCPHHANGDLVFASARFAALRDFPPNNQVGKDTRRCRGKIGHSAQLSKPWGSIIQPYNVTAV